MWFSAIPCLFCLAVGIIVSFASKAQNPKKLNPDLVSPMLPKLFSWWPFIGDKIGDWFENGIGLGIEYVSIMFCQMFIYQYRIYSTHIFEIIYFIHFSFLLDSRGEGGKIETESNSRWDRNEQFKPKWKTFFLHGRN